MRKLAMAVVILFSALIVSGCSAGPDEVDIKAMTEALRETVRFEDELNLADEATAETIYQIEDAVRSYVYIGSGATAEEIAAFELKDENAAAEALEKVKNRLAEQKDNFASYVPREVNRLEKAVVKRSGRYVAVCVSEDEAAQKIISEYMG